ncbi:MAG: MDR/zinc-dependent alcohol dehydrogenase-like family protein [Phycisphaerae bacterium]
MRAILFDGSSVKFQRNHPDPIPAPGEALLKILAAGVCQTDLEIAKGYMNFTGVLGHEFVATVTALPKGAPPNDQHWLGKRVVGEINCVCGKCDMCNRGLSSHCFHRSVIGIQGRDGAFADFLRIPTRNLHALPDHLSNDEAVFVEPLAAAFQILRQVPIEKRTRVTVLGDGRLGLLVAQTLARTGCKLTLVGKHESKLSLIERIRTGAANNNIRTLLDRELTTARDQDVVIDCTGRAEGFERALQLLRPRGTLVMKTTVAANKPLNLAPIVIDEINVLGSRCGPFPEAINQPAARQIDESPPNPKRLPLDQLEPFFANPPAGLKTIVTFDR